MDIKHFQPFIQKAWEKAGFKQFTSVQEKAIPFLLEHQDAMIESATGTGKTLGYALPALQRMDTSIANAQAILLAPTRELAMQIHAVLQNFSEGSGITGAALIGGAAISRQIEKLKKKPHYIVGTPGRVLELINAKKLKMHEVKTIVIDEADIMIDMGLMDSVQSIIKATTKDRQLVFVSATISSKTKELANEWMKEPIFVRVENKKTGETNVEHLYMVSERRDKIENLRRLIRHHNEMKALVFISENMRLDEFAAKLEYRGISLGILAGRSSKQEREKVLREFRASKHAILLSTDIAARGLDVQGITHVIHFDLPESNKQFVHRSGRTGRMGAKGTVISLVTEKEERVLLKWAKQLEITVQKAYLYKGSLIKENRSNLL